MAYEAVSTPGLLDARLAVSRLETMRLRASDRLHRQRRVLAIRRGDYEEVAPGMLPEDFDKALVANLIDTAAHDLSEVMAPLPSISCSSSSQTSDTQKKAANKRALIANSYVQRARLSDQMYVLADRYCTFGFGAYIVEPDFEDKCPTIRVDRSMECYFTQDYRDRVVEYAAVNRIHVDELCHWYPEYSDQFRNHVYNRDSQEIEVVEWYDKNVLAIFCPEMPLVLHEVENPFGQVLVRIVGRPSIDGEKRGQFDDVIGVQVARAIIAQYTLSAVQQSVEAPIALPRDVQELELGPFSAVHSDNPQGIGRVNLQIPAGLFPEQASLAQEQRVGSRYPEGRSGQMDASIITGQGVQALMGTFDTQVQTFQRLFASALEDVVAMCFELDEALWPEAKKTRRIKDNGAPRKFEYTPAKDIAGDHVVDVSYGAIAGLDPNRGLVFVLQALAGGLIAKSTARKSLPVDLNVIAEERQIQLEGIDDSVAATLAMLPQAIPMMATQGMDPREIVLQTVQVRKLVQKGKSIVEAMEEVFAPKEEEPAPPASPLDQALGAGAGPEALPGAGGGGASDMLMMLAGMTPGGNVNSQASVSRMIPAQG